MGTDSFHGFEGLSCCCTCFEDLVFRGGWWASGAVGSLMGHSDLVWRFLKDGSRFGGSDSPRALSIGKGKQETWKVDDVIETCTV